MSLNVSGCLPAIVTPIDENENIDQKGLKSLINNILGAGVNGLVLLGSTGEGPMLAEDERYKAMEIAVKEINGKVPIIAGTSDTSTRKIKANIKQAEKAGVDAVITLPPFYFQQTQETIIKFYQEIAIDSILPVFIYNFPQISKMHILPHTINILSKEENILGIKDSGGDFKEFQKLLLYQTEKFFVFQGHGALSLPSILLGAKGLIGIIANIAPALEIALINAVQKGQIEEAKMYQDIINNVSNILMQSGPPCCAIKALLKDMGICNNTTINPNPQLSQEQLAHIKDRINELDIYLGFNKG